MKVTTVRALDYRREDSRRITRTIDGIEVEAGIPIPPKARNRIINALLQLDIGESFVVTHNIGSSKKAPSEQGRRFEIRKIGAKQWRVWRVS